MKIFHDVFAALMHIPASSAHVKTTFPRSGPSGCSSDKSVSHNSHTLHALSNRSGYTNSIVHHETDLYNQDRVIVKQMSLSLTDNIDLHSDLDLHDLVCPNDHHNLSNMIIFGKIARLWNRPHTLGVDSHLPTILFALNPIRYFFLPSIQISRTTRVISDGFGSELNPYRGRELRNPRGALLARTFMRW